MTITVCKPALPLTSRVESSPTKRYIWILFGHRHEFIFWIDKNNDERESQSDKAALHRVTNFISCNL